MLYLPTIITIIEVLIIILPVLFVVAFVIVAERKTMASMQRRGPNIVGYYGLIHAFAHALKFLLKEYVSPTQANYFLFFPGTIIRYVSNNIKLLYLFVPSGCPSGLLAISFLIEFISYLAIILYLGLTLLAYHLIEYGHQIMYLVYTTLNNVYWKYIILLIEGRLVVYMHWAITIYLFIYLRWDFLLSEHCLSFFFSQDLLTRYSLHMEGGGDSGSGGLPPTMENSELGNSGDNNPPKAPVVKAEGHIQLSVWPLYSTGKLYEVAPWIKSVDYLYVKIQPGCGQNPGGLSFIDKEGSVGYIPSKYIIASLGVHDIHISPNNITMFKSGDNQVTLSVDNLRRLQLKGTGSWNISMGSEQNYYTINKWTTFVRKGPGRTIHD